MHPNLDRPRLTLIALMFLLATLACTATGGAEPDPAALETQVAQSVQQTLDAGIPDDPGSVEATADTGGTAPTPTTPPTSAPAETPLPTKTPEPTQPPNSGGCPDAAFVTDVTIPDNTRVAPGEQFVKTWRFKNDGTCALTGPVFTRETTTAIIGPGIVFLPDLIQPGQEFEISIRLIAPTAAGTYKEIWKFDDCLFCPNPITFGPKPYVQIVVDPALADSSRGRIMGSILYPSEGHPEMAIYAQKVDDASVWAGVEVPGEGGGGYSLAVPPGKYVVYAYSRFEGGGSPPPSLFGAYANINCAGSSCIVTFKEVTVGAGQFLTGIDLDFFAPDQAPAGTYPDHLP
jgi:hypothetical protein